MNQSPIALFVYNRLEHTKITVQYLIKNKYAKNSILYIFSDGSKNEENNKKVTAVREFIEKITGFKEIHIIKQKNNLGLANSIIKGVTKVINKHGKVIVLEDDLITSPLFLYNMNLLLKRYKNNKRIYSISGYNYSDRILKIPNIYPYEIYFNPRAGSWGWATWKDRWRNTDWEIKDYSSFSKSISLQNQFNLGGDDLTNMLKMQMEKRIDSWAIRWCYTLFKNNAYCIYPTKSLVNNIGLDGSGTHCGKGVYKKYDNKFLSHVKLSNLPNDVKLDEGIFLSFRNIFKKQNHPWFIVIIKKVIRNAERYENLANL